MILDNILQYWTIFDQFWQYWTIFVNIGHYISISNNIITNLAISSRLCCFETFWILSQWVNEYITHTSYRGAFAPKNSGKNHIKAFLAALFISIMRKRDPTYSGGFKNSKTFLKYPQSNNGTLERIKLDNSRQYYKR